MSFYNNLNRRSFIKASIWATLALCYGDNAMALVRPEDRLPLGRLALRNVHTGERLAVTYRDQTGRYNRAALDAVNRLLRCHYTNTIHPIDVRTLEHLNLAMRRMGTNKDIHVISGYRSPEYNAMLRRQSRKVASHSLHMEGRAIDFRIPGVSLSTVRRAALSLAYGGVGYYPGNDFVHLDSGAFRTW